MNDRRKAHRATSAGSVLYRVRRLLGLGPPRAGHVIDVSETGLKFGVFENLPIGMPISIVLPGAVLADPRLDSVEVRGRVVWWRRIDRQSYSTAGVEFEGVPEEARSALRACAAKDALRRMQASPPAQESPPAMPSDRAGRNPLPLPAPRQVRRFYGSTAAWWTGKVPEKSPR